MKTFKQKVYEICDSIPKGRVATYGQIARLAGRPRAARAVGYYMRTNPDAPITPCHRVVASDGRMTGYSGKGGIPGKIKMLKKEGVKFIGGRVDLLKSQWSS